MRKKATHIPVTAMPDESGLGITIGRASVTDLPTFGEAGPGAFEKLGQSHRHDYHLFFLQEAGMTSIEIDFKKHNIKPSSVLYIHPNQVHRMLGTMQHVTISGWAINNENLNSGYLKLLDDIAPAKPLSLNKEAFSIIHDAVSLCIKLSERKQEKLHHTLLKDSCNTLVALTISQYLAQSGPTATPSRFEVITKAFKSILEHHYTTAKKPAEYAQRLNVSAPYLNECVKNATGYPVSYHIQQRIILEAKRLLYHSDKSVKEIASGLGYDDYPYFSRLFSKVAGMTPLTFRSKNLG
jgi:AraC family transcriptional activator of pobA